jgi:hypothetical protein
MISLRNLLSTVSIIALVALPAASASAREYVTVKPGQDGTLESNGVITPLDQEMKNFYIRNADGVIEVKLTPNAIIGVQSRIQRGGFAAGKLQFALGKKTYSYKLPKTLYVRYRFKDWKTAQRALKDPTRTLWGGKIYVTPLKEHLPSESQLWLVGKMTKAEGREKLVAVNGKTFKIGTQGHDGQERFMGLISRKDIKPFVQQAFVHGTMKGDVFHADEVGIRMLPDVKELDDPKLPRYLFVGDSISGNYDRALRQALKGKFNLHHPPTNCGNSKKNLDNISQWMGAYDRPGMGWAVISFNFGHWDSGNTKANYQTNMEGVIKILAKSKAKLIYVTTCPVPGGYQLAPDPIDKGGETKAPGRKHGVMKKYINPWAMEVLARHPEITICDQYALVAGEKFYKPWHENSGAKNGKGNEYGDVHLGGLLSQPIGRQLARTVLDVMGRKNESLAPIGITDRDLDPKRQRPSTKSMDTKDYLDLLKSDRRLRKYNKQKR